MKKLLTILTLTLLPTFLFGQFYTPRAEKFKVITASDTGSVSKVEGRVYFCITDTTVYVANGSYLVSVATGTGGGGGSGSTTVDSIFTSVTLDTLIVTTSGITDTLFVTIDDDTTYYDTDNIHRFKQKVSVKEELLTDKLTVGAGATGIGVSDSSFVGVTNGQLSTNAWISFADFITGGMFYLYPNGNLSTNGSVSGSNILNKVDSTGTGADSYSSRTALVDTAASIRTAMPSSDSTWKTITVEDTAYIDSVLQVSKVLVTKDSINLNGVGVYSPSGAAFEDNSNLFIGRFPGNLGHPVGVLDSPEDPIKGNIIIGNNPTFDIWDDGFTEAGHNNIGIGNNVFGNSLRTGEYNIALGLDALQNLSNDSHNIGIGYKAGENLGSTNNVLIGTRAGDDLTSGGYNTAVGAYASYSTGAYEFNTSLGYRSGAFTDGDENVFLGAYIRNSGGTSNSIYIGYNAKSNSTNDWDYGRDSVFVLGVDDEDSGNRYVFGDLHRGTWGWNTYPESNVTFNIKNKSETDKETFSVSQETWIGSITRTGDGTEPNGGVTDTYNGTGTVKFIIASDSLGNDYGGDYDDVWYKWTNTSRIEGIDTTWVSFGLPIYDMFTSTTPDTFNMDFGVRWYFDFSYRDNADLSDTLTFTAYPQSNPLVSLKSSNNTTKLFGKPSNNGFIFNSSIAIESPSTGGSNFSFVLGDTVSNDSIVNGYTLYTGEIRQTIWNPTSFDPTEAFSFSGTVENEKELLIGGSYNSNSNTEHRFKIDTLAHDTIPNWDYLWSTKFINSNNNDIAYIQLDGYTHGFTKDNIVKLVTLDRTDSIDVLCRYIDSNSLEFIYLHHENYTDPYTNAQAFTNNSPFCSSSTDSVLIQKYVLDISLDDGSTWAVQDTNLVSNIESDSYTFENYSSTVCQFEVGGDGKIYNNQPPWDAYYNTWNVNPIKTSTGLKLFFTDSWIVDDSYITSFEVGDYWDATAGSYTRWEDVMTWTDSSGTEFGRLGIEDSLLALDSLQFKVTDHIFPDEDGGADLGIETTNQWANVWADLVNGSDYAFLNDYRILESEKYKGYDEGIAIGNTHFKDGVITEKMPKEAKPIFVITEGFIEYQGVRFDREELILLKKLISGMKE